MGLVLRCRRRWPTHFVQARVRRFHTAHLDQAIAWATAADDHPGRFELLEGYPPNVLALRAHGVISGQDYEEMLTPLLDSKLRTYDKIGVLIVLGPEFDSYGADAVWDDTKLAFTHLRAFSKIALVTDIGWNGRSRRFRQKSGQGDQLRRLSILEYRRQHK